MKKIPTLYEWAGDTKTFETLFTRFYDKVLKDDLLGEVFSNMSPEHVVHVSHFVAEVLEEKSSIPHEVRAAIPP